MITFHGDDGGMAMLLVTELTFCRAVMEGHRRMYKHRWGTKKLVPLEQGMEWRRLRSRKGFVSVKVGIFTISLESLFHHSLFRFDSGVSRYP